MTPTDAKARANARVRWDSARRQWLTAHGFASTKPVPGYYVMRPFDSPTGVRFVSGPTHRRTRSLERCWSGPTTPARSLAGTTLTRSTYGHGAPGIRSPRVTGDASWRNTLRGLRNGS